MSATSEANDPPVERAPQHHRTIDRVTKILEEVVYHPGMTFTDLSRALDAPKSSVHGFVRGLIAAGWLHQDDTRFYIGPALYGLTLASGHLRAGAVTDADLMALHEAAGITVFLGVPAGDNLIYVSEIGAELLPSFGARSNIRRGLLETAGGKALLAAMPADQRDAYLRRRPDSEAELIDRFFSEFDQIVMTRIARNTLHSGTQYALGTVVGGPTGRAAAEVTLVGRTAEMRAREAELSALLLEHVDRWSARSAAN
ncbi:IclR family transcriptional regulator [Tsukamurella soli]|uniref:HTH iclR-type domain-containing protein n=1 Tax=Tsukamurella soli TaxID=644556 RepID=A0ABP8KAY1_9ACTN